MAEENKIMINRTIRTELFAKKEVEIIIPFYGKHSLVSSLVEDIFNTVYSNRYLVTLVDDGSANKEFHTQIQKSKVPGLRCLRQKQNRGFGSSINFALSNPWKFENNPTKEIPYVLIMHSDVSLDSKDWLLNLGNFLETVKKDNVKMVSPKTDNPVVDFDVLKSKRSFKGENYVLKTEFLPLYCALAHRDLFKHVGFFKEYPYAGLEAEEFAMRMISKGFNQAVCGTSWVSHIGRGTLQQFDKNRKVKEILRKTKELHDKDMQKTNI